MELLLREANHYRERCSMDNKERILKISRTCRIVSKVLYILNLVACPIFLALAIAMPLTCAIAGMTAAESAITFSTLTLYAFLLIDLLWNTTKLFETIEREQAVFGVGVTKYVRKIARAVIVVSLIPSLVGSILIHALAPESEFNFRIQLIGIAAGVVLYFIGLFFHYGEELQKLNDETL